MSEWPWKRTLEKMGDWWRLEILIAMMILKWVIDMYMFLVE